MLQPEEMDDREKTHGSYAEFARLEQSLQNTFCSLATSSMSDVQISAVNMILHKLARIGTGDPGYMDHWDDIAGYAQRGAGK